MSSCPTCDAATSPTAAFCAGCGTRLGPVESPTLQLPLTPLSERLPLVVDPRPRRGLAAPVIIGVALAVVLGLLGGAFLLARDSGTAPAVPAVASPSSTPSASAQPRSSPTASAESSAPPSRPLLPTAVEAPCVAPPGRDSSGETVSYEPALMVDGDPTTAWRCPGAAVGTRLVFRFAEPVTVTSVGLVPGYAKTDPADGTDRFAENRTVTAVVWSLADGTSYRQDVPTPSRATATFALPAPAETTGVTLEIAGTGNDGAPRDFTAISEVTISGY